MCFQNVTEDPRSPKQLAMDAVGEDLGRNEQGKHGNSSISNGNMSGQENGMSSDPKGE